MRRIASLIVLKLCCSNGFVVPIPGRRTLSFVQPLRSAVTQQDLQSVFEEQSGDDGFMTFEQLKKVPDIQDMLNEGDLLPNELDEMWTKQCGNLGKIDSQAFFKLYNAIDDLFEDEVDEGQDSVVDDESAPENEEATEDLVEEPLDDVFAKLSDEEGVVPKTSLRAWDEISRLIAENLLGEDEFESAWSRATKTSDAMDLDGFLKFNALLDELFEFEDDDDDDEDETGQAGGEDSPVAVDTATAAVKATAPKAMIKGEDLPPGVIFASIANEDYTIQFEDLQYWSELQEMLSEGDLLQKELDDIYAANAKGGKLDEAGFIKLYEAIDALFVDEDEEDGGATQTAETEDVVQNEVKLALEEFLEELNNDDERLPCGLESTDREVKVAENIVAELENSPTNLILKQGGNIQPSDLTGEWELLYTSSSAMKFNKGLSGLGGSVPNGKFGGLRQILKYTKWVSDVEYKEKIEVNPSSASFNVQITGVWDLRNSVSMFTGEPCTSLAIEPDRVNYGPTSTRADHWKSIGPTNMLDITYLDEDLRVMRGNTATDSILVFRRVA